MTVSTTIIKNSHSGNGTAHSFAYGFKIFADGDLDVIVRSSTGTETVKTLNTDYIVTNAGNDSGGNVLFKFNTGTSSDAHFSSSDKRPQNGETVILRRGLDITQSTDYVANDPFPAESHENALDRLTLISQELQEELDRSIKLSRTNTMTSTEFTVGATDRASKVLAFDSSGEISVTQELGTFKGDWAASTAYVIRDIVKDTSTNNIFIVTSAHTSSGSQPLTTNANSAKYSLIVDAASATTSATNAASSATAAASSATAAASSASTASTQASNASTSASTASTQATNAASSATAAANAQAAAEAALDTFDDRFLGAKSSNPTVDNDGNALLDGALYFDTTNDIMKVYDLTNTQWRQLTLTSTNQTNVNTVAGIQANVTTVAGISSDVTTVAGISSNVSTVASAATNVNNVGGSITNVNTVASNLSGVNSFAERYRVQSGVPSSDNDVGDLVFDTAANTLKVFGSSGFQNAGSSVNGTSERFTYNITGTPTTLTGASGTGFAEANSQTLAYDAGFIDVYLNGVKMVNGTDVTVTSGDSVVFASALSNGDVVDIVTFGTFSLSSINASNLSSGTVPIARLGSSGTKDSTTFLRGDNTFATVTTTTINNNADNRIITGSGSANTLEAETGLTYDSGTLAQASGDFTIDVGGDIILDANGGDILLKDDGTHFATLTNSSTDFEIGITTADKDIKFKGNDGGSDITAMTIDMSEGGKVGIKTTTPSSYYAQDLVVSADNQGGITIVGATTDTGQYLAFADGTSGSARYSGYIQYAHNSNEMLFGVNGSEVMRHNGSNLLVGTTNNSPAEGSTTGVRIGGNGASQFSASGQAALTLNRTTDFGSIIEFRDDGTLIGRIGTNGSFGIGMGDTGFYFASNVDAIVPCDAANNFTNRDGAIDVGYSSVRFRHAYFTGSFTSSDKNEKQDIEDLTETEKKVATKCKGLIKKFRYKDRVAEKGDDARIHVGVIAQELKEAFASEGLDAHRYSIYSETTWWEKEISVDAVKEDKEKGIEARDAFTYMDQKFEKTEGYTERTRCMVNYDELLAFIISAL